MESPCLGPRSNFSGYPPLPLFRHFFGGRTLKRTEGRFAFEIIRLWLFRRRRCMRASRDKYVIPAHIPMATTPMSQNKSQSPCHMTNVLRPRFDLCKALFTFPILFCQLGSTLLLSGFDDTRGCGKNPHRLQLRENLSFRILRHKLCI